MGVGLFLFLFFNVSLNTFFLTLEHLKVDVLHNIMIELSLEDLISELLILIAHSVNLVNFD